MVFIDGVKYACETCIKGHRSTACQHTDRQLFAIKRKGRPISQCSHCRELRKTQKIHVKCNCNGKKKEEPIWSQPQDVVAVVVTPQDDNDDDYQPTSGNKTSVESLLNPCQCLTGAECICCRPVEQYFSGCNSRQYTMNTNNNNDNSPYLQMTPNTVSSAQTPPPSANHDNTRGKSTNPLIPSWENHPSYSGHNNFSVGFTSVNSQNLQERSYVQSSSSPYNNDNDDISHDQSGVLGKEICSSTSADLANIIYRPFQSCSSAMADGGCCGSMTTMVPICRCGSGCKCSGCDTHAERVNINNSYNNSTSQQNQPKPSSCCSSSYDFTQPEHTVIRDGDGVLLCGCGCQKLDTECSDCLDDLCEEYLLKENSM